MTIDVEKSDTGLKIWDRRVGMSGRTGVEDQLTIEPIVGRGMVVTEDDHFAVRQHCPGDIVIIAEFFYLAEQQ